MLRKTLHRERYSFGEVVPVLLYLYIGRQLIIDNVAAVLFLFLLLLF